MGRIRLRRVGLATLGRSASLTGHLAGASDPVRLLIGAWLDARSIRVWPAPGRSLQRLLLGSSCHWRASSAQGSGIYCWSRHVTTRRQALTWQSGWRWDT